MKRTESHGDSNFTTHQNMPVGLIWSRLKSECSKQQCLDRRIGDRATLESEIAAWQVKRNASAAKIQWLFDVARAREKMGHAYPKPMLAEPDEGLPVAAE